jgi:hypothetical protein
MNHNNIMYKLQRLRLKKLSEQQKDTMWQHVEERISVPRKRSILSPFVMVGSRSVVAALLVLALFGGSFVTVARANIARPGDTLYPVDRAAESILLAIYSGERQDEFRVAIARERIEEFREILNEEEARLAGYASSNSATATSTELGMNFATATTTGQSETDTNSGSTTDTTNGTSTATSTEESTDEAATEENGDDNNDKRPDRIEQAFTMTLESLIEHRDRLREPDVDTGLDEPQHREQHGGGHGGRGDRQAERELRLLVGLASVVVRRRPVLCGHRSPVCPARTSEDAGLPQEIDRRFEVCEL